MLHQLEFKLHVERQYKEGIDKMAKLYLLDGDKKARSVFPRTPRAYVVPWSSSRLPTGPIPRTNASSPTRR